MAHNTNNTGSPVESTESCRLELVKLIITGCISVIVLVGGGVLAATNPEVRGEVGVFVGMTVGFWFGKKNGGNGNGSR
ncbi:MAG: hypothetical protein ACREKR_13760 [Candidatus Methylomirabilales bacterium]